MHSYGFRLLNGADVWIARRPGAADEHEHDDEDGGRNDERSAGDGRGVVCGGAGRGGAGFWGV